MRHTAFALGATAMVWSHAPSPAVEAADPATRCEGIVFDDVDVDGTRDRGEPGIGGVTVHLDDARGLRTTRTTGDDGRWVVDPDQVSWPLRIEVAIPDHLRPSRRGPDHASDVQFVARAADCGDGGIASFALYEPGAACDPDAPIVVGCFVVDHADDYDDRPAIQLVDADTVDDGSTDGDTQADWLGPDPTTIAVHRDVGAVYGMATDHRGAVYAASFVKRHTRLTSRLNPTGNPTTIYRVVPGQPVEIFATLDPDATDPHDHAGADDHDERVFDDVYTVGIGDIEVSPDGSLLYAIDLTHRELVTLSTTQARVVGRFPLDGEALGVTDCAVDERRPFGDLRPFGLGFDSDGSLLIGVVCSAESTVPADQAIDESNAPGLPLGDPDGVVGRVYELRGDHVVERLSWPLARDRGDTQNNGLISNDATWHPWVPAVPFEDEHDVVSYPQPAITDLAVDHAGNLIIALGDRWGHQTAPSTWAPTVTGDTHEITEPVAAGDLQRACPDGEGWVIEGSDGCPGGWGNGFEFFDGDRYGWHAETVLGSVIAVPDGSDETTLVVSQMDPVPGTRPWFSGGLAWHSSATGSVLSGARLYDGRFAEPDTTFEHASGITDLARLCDAAPLEIGGRAWHDTDADGRQDPGEHPIAEIRLELRDAGGDVLATATTDEHGNYRFGDDSVPGGLIDGAEYLVTVALWNYEAGPFGVDGDATGLRPTSRDPGVAASLDSNGRVGGDVLTTAGLTMAAVVAGDDPSTTWVEGGIDHSVDFGFRDQYDLAVATRWVRNDDVLGVLAFEIIVHNQGSEPSRDYEIANRLPAGTELVAASRGATSDPSGRVLTWSFVDDDQLAPGESRELTVLVRVTDDSRSPFANTVQIVADGGADDDSTPGDADFDVVLRRDDAFLPDGTLVDDNGGAALDDDADVALVYLHQITGRLWIDPDRDGQYEPDPPRDGAAVGEQPAAGVAVVLLHADGTEIERQWTTHNGSYQFSMVPSGRYTIHVPTEEFDASRSLHGYDWMRSAYRTGAFEPADGLDLPLMLRAGSDSVVDVRVGVAHRPGRGWGWLFAPRLVLPSLLVAAAGLLLLQRRANRAELLAA
jgi:hypothetical protein